MDKILAVDDTPAILSLLSDNLKNYQVDCQMTYSKGLSSYRNDDYKVVILDYDLGEKMTGMDLAKEMRRQNPVQTILFVSGEPNEYLENYVKNEVDVYLLEKPFNPKRLREVVDDLSRFTPLEKLRKLVPLLSVPVLHEESKEAMVEYDVRGTALGFGLLKKDSIAIQDTFMSKDSTFPLHLHEKEIEFCIVYEGKLEVSREDIASYLSDGESIQFSPLQTHSMTALEDTWAIYITIPAERGYPDART